jgi:hypothetical protein
MSIQNLRNLCPDYPIAKRNVDYPMIFEHSNASTNHKKLWFKFHASVERLKTDIDPVPREVKTIVREHKGTSLVTLHLECPKNYY